MYATINNISLSYHLVKHIVCPFLQKEAIKNVIKCFVMLEIQKKRICQRS